MSHELRKVLISKVQELREGRKCICLFNFDRDCDPHYIPGLTCQFALDVKEPLFRVLKESRSNQKIDLFFYTRGGQLDAVWPIVSLLREFDKDFEVLVPFACNSAGTVVSLGAKKIHLTPISELSPIDPTGGNQFNPEDEIAKGVRVGISVEDVAAYREFVVRQFGYELETLNDDGADAQAKARAQELLAPYLARLTDRVHPLALGNIHRVQQQGRRLARELLRLHTSDHKEIDGVIDQLSSKFFSHRHMLNRQEARDLFGDRVVFADGPLSQALDDLLRAYEQDFQLRRKFVANEQFTQPINEKEVRFIGGAVESYNWSYLFETKLRIRRVPVVPPNINIQLQPNQGLTPVAGLPTRIDFDRISEGWVRNTSPQGYTV